MTEKEWKSDEIWICTPFAGVKVLWKLYKETDKQLKFALKNWYEWVKKLWKKTWDTVVSTWKQIRLVLDNQYFQLALDIAWLVPWAWVGPDLINAMIYLSQTPSNYTFALLSLVSCLTIAGDVVWKWTKLWLVWLKTGRWAKHASIVLKKMQKPLKALYVVHKKTFDKLFWSAAQKCTNSVEKAQEMKAWLDAALQDIIGHNEEPWNRVSFSSLGNNWDARNVAWGNYKAAA